MLTPEQIQLAEKFVENNADAVCDEYERNGNDMILAIQTVALENVNTAIALKVRLDNDPELKDYIFECVLNKKLPFTS
jgi:hypothetical protein